MSKRRRSRAAQRTRDSQGHHDSRTSPTQSPPSNSVATTPAFSANSQAQASSTSLLSKLAFSPSPTRRELFVATVGAAIGAAGGPYIQYLLEERHKDRHGMGSDFDVTAFYGQPDVVSIGTNLPLVTDEIPSAYEMKLALKNTGDFPESDLLITLGIETARNYGYVPPTATTRDDGSISWRFPSTPIGVNSAVRTGEGYIQYPIPDGAPMPEVTIFDEDGNVYLSSQDKNYTYQREYFREILGLELIRLIPGQEVLLKCKFYFHFYSFSIVAQSSSFSYRDMYVNPRNLPDS